MFYYVHRASSVFLFMTDRLASSDPLVNVGEILLREQRDLPFWPVGRLPFRDLMDEPHSRFPSSQKERNFFVVDFFIQQVFLFLSFRFDFLSSLVVCCWHFHHERPLSRWMACESDCDPFVWVRLNGCNKVDWFINSGRWAESYDDQSSEYSSKSSSSLFLLRPSLSFVLLARVDWQLVE